VVDTLRPKALPGFSRDSASAGKRDYGHIFVFHTMADQLGQANSYLPPLTWVAANLSGLMCLPLVKLDDRQAFRRWARTARIAAKQTGDTITYFWV